VKLFCVRDPGGGTSSQFTSRRRRQYASELVVFATFPLNDAFSPLSAHHGLTDASSDSFSAPRFLIDDRRANNSIKNSTLLTRFRVNFINVIFINYRFHNPTNYNSKISKISFLSYSSISVAFY